MASIVFANPVMPGPKKDPDAGHVRQRRRGLTGSCAGQAPFGSWIRSPDRSTNRPAPRRAGAASATGTGDRFLVRFRAPR
jgi:hypothetical protein